MALLTAVAQVVMVLIFSINANDTDGSTFRAIYSFTPDNFTIYGSLIISNGVLYGMSGGGGTNSAGTIFSINTDGTNFRTVYSFGGTDGTSPYGSLTISNGVLYGMTTRGGVNGEFGTIFSINANDTDGTSFRVIHSFDGTDGSLSNGALLISGSVIYGLANQGGANSVGTIFSINTDGTGFTKFYDFDGANGSYPNGSLTISNNVLYGMTMSGGTAGAGTIFSINTDGTGFTKLYDFSDANGTYPMGSFIISNNILYGMTNTTNVDYSGYGVIFSYQP